MIKSSELAGYFAAHAIWCVSDGEGFIPIFAFTTEAGDKQMQRLAHDNVAEAIEFGKHQLINNPMDANDAVLVYDGRLKLDSGKSDAIILELRAYFSPESEVVIGIPYTPCATGKFAVHKPKLLVKENCQDFETSDIFEAFFAGVASHEQGARVWIDSLDESR